MIGDDSKIDATQKTVKDAVADYMESKHGTNRQYETINLSLSCTILSARQGPNDPWRDNCRRVSKRDDVFHNEICPFSILGEAGASKDEYPRPRSIVFLAMAPQYGNTMSKSAPCRRGRAPVQSCSTLRSTCAR